MTLKPLVELVVTDVRLATRMQMERQRFQDSVLLARRDDVLGIVALEHLVDEDIIEPRQIDGSSRELLALDSLEGPADESQ